MKLSVVIPFWNSERWLATSIKSALGQGVDAEVIAVDDGSTDGGLAVAAAFQPRIKVLRQANGGVSVARNHGLAEATGDYVVFLDADDYFDGPVLRGVAAAAAKGGQDIIFSQSASESAAGRIPHSHRSSWPEMDPIGIARDVAHGRTVTVQAQAFRREMLLRLGGYRVGDISNQDTELVLRTLLLGASVGFNDEGVAIWALRPDHGGLSTRRDIAMLSSTHAWHDEHLRTLPVRSDPGLREAYAMRSYGIACLAFEGRHRQLGREALKLARAEGFSGHHGGAAHRWIAAAIGLERKIVLARTVRTLRRALGFSGQPISP